MLQEKMDTTVSVCATDSLSDTHTHTLRLIKWESRFIVGSQGVTDPELQDSHNVSCRPDSSVFNSACSVCPKVPRPPAKILLFNLIDFFYLKIKVFYWHHVNERVNRNCTFLVFTISPSVYQVVRVRCHQNHHEWWPLTFLMFKSIFFCYLVQQIQQWTDLLSEHI